VAQAIPLGQWGWPATPNADLGVVSPAQGAKPQLFIFIFDLLGVAELPPRAMGVVRPPTIPKGPNLYQFLFMFFFFFFLLEVADPYPQAMGVVRNGGDRILLLLLIFNFF
jgi:hypothetical protein